MKTTNKSVIDFSEWLRGNPLPGKHRRGSENTIQNYVSDVDRFARWFKQSTGYELSAESLTPDDIQDFISKLQAVEGRKPNTVLRYFAAIRAYCLYLLKTDSRIMRDLTDGIRLPRQEPMTKRGLRRKERLAVERVFTVPWKDTEAARLRLIRDYAIVETMMYVGLRLGVLANLKLDDLMLGERSGSIHVRQGKGNRNREAGVPLKARQALTEWLSIREMLDCPHDFLFVQIRKGYKPLGIRSVQEMVKEVGKRAKLEIELSPHILRHTAVRIWRQKTDDRTTAAQMGHSITTMMKYDSLSGDDVLVAAERI
ncbi:MAG: tyrosine-type recombinase/integrase [Anaerolineae bacterium]|jgi:site-specific recombinase XerC|nr:tyrosine-type recombinase/integrase [Anaerolineae bacterium]MBT7774504.1 tyrosine-type recombinase/integrase [Anaerolineae bacterium]